MNKTTSTAGCRRFPALAIGGSPWTRVRRLSAVLACASAVVVLAACSSGGGTQSGNADPAGGSGSSSPTLGSVTIGKAVDTIGFTTVDVAKAEGYFAKQGVSVSDELLNGSSTAFAALESGSVNFVTASSTALIAAKAKGLPLEAVASLDYGVSLQLLVSDNWAKAHGLSVGQPLDTVMKKMVGAKIGVISTTDLTYDHYLEEQAGVSTNQFTYINISSQSAALAAVKYGEIDAFLLSPPSGFYAQAQGGATVMASLHEVPNLANMAYDILVVDSNWAKTHTAEVKAVATAMAMADNIMRTDPQAVLETEQKHYPTMSSSVLLNSLKYVTFTPDGEMSPGMWQLALTEYKDTTNANVSSVDVSENGGVWTNQYIEKSGL
jgi:NitT/TauT family transport system substrate-binding protein